MESLSAKYGVKNYQINIWYIKDSSCGNFTEISFLARFCAVGHLTNNTPLTLRKVFRVLLFVQSNNTNMFSFG